MIMRGSFSAALLSGVLLIAGVFGLFCMTGCSESNCVYQEAAVTAAPQLVVPDDFQDIQQAIESLPLAGGAVYIRSGDYLLQEGLHVNRSNISIWGEPGVLLKLANNVNQPVLLVGSDEEIPVEVIVNVKISNLEIDGNMENQNSEFDISRPWIRNNGIDIRRVENLWVSEVMVHDARSGGIVVSWGSQTIFVYNSGFDSNFFDGIALYDSEDIQISSFMCRDNAAAGISLDNELKRVHFNGGIVMGNRTVGIFIRDSMDIMFDGLAIYNNVEEGCFMSHDDRIVDRASGVERVFFGSCSFIDNGRYGLWLASPVLQSTGNAVVGCLFSGNVSGAINVHQEGELFQEANVFQ